VGSWLNQCEYRCFSEDSVDNYGYTEIMIAGSVLTFEPGRNRMNKKCQDHGEFLRCVDKKFVLMFLRKVLRPSSGRLNLLSVVYGMTVRRECVHYVAILGTIGLDSSVGVATRYGLDGSRIESLQGRYFPHPSTPAVWPIQLRTQ
jgi:hypothetical protein